MNKQQFLKSIENTYKKNLEITRKKNSDYAGQGDPFRNFRQSELLGVSVERAILVRMMDKMMRVSNLLDKEAEVDEAVEETLADLCNYSAIMIAYLQSKVDNKNQQ